MGNSKKGSKKWSKSGQKVGFLTHFLLLFLSVFGFSKRGKKGRFHEKRGPENGPKSGFFGILVPFFSVF